MNDTSAIDENFFPILKSSILFSAHKQTFCVCYRGISQFVFALNSSAETLIRSAIQSGSCDQLVETYGRALGVPSDIAREFIAIVQDDWRSVGALGPEVHAFESPVSADASPPRDAVPAFDQIVSVGCDPVRAVMYDSELSAVTAPMIRTDSPPQMPHAPFTLTAWLDGAIWHTQDSSGIHKVFRDVQAARDSILTDLVRNSRASLGDAAAIHGATLRTPTGKHIMLSGDSGRGKTTLALALAKSGFTLLSDDICTFDAESGHVVPIMMNPSVKEGAWTALSGLYPELAGQQPVDIKGRLCKYVQRNNKPTDSTPHSIDVLVFPNWQPGAKAHLTPFDGHQSLLSMLRWSYLPNDPDRIQAMADFLTRIPLYELTYSEFSDAKSSIMELPECQV